MPRFSADSPSLALASTILPCVSSLAQDKRELEQERTASKKLKGEHPLTELMRTRRSALRPELLGVHPRVYVTEKELGELRERARGSHHELWQRAISHVRALAGDPPPPPAEQRRQQNDVGIAIFCAPPVGGTSRVAPLPAFEMKARS